MFQQRITRVAVALTAAIGSVTAVTAVSALTAGSVASAAANPAPAGAAVSAGAFSGADNLAVSRAGVWIFDDAANGGRGAIAELSTATGRLIHRQRESQPGQIAWVAAAYGNHPWTIALGPSGKPWLAEVSPSTGALARRVRLAYFQTPESPVAGAAALAGSRLWAVTASASDGAPTGLVQVSASSGARTGFVRWPKALRGFDPVGLTVSGAQIWMTDGGCQVARVSVRGRGPRVFTLPGRDCLLGTLPAQISVAGDHVWVQAYDTHSANDESVAELSASTGRVLRLISGRPGWDFASFTAAGSDLWVTSQSGGYRSRGTVTEISARTGRVVRRFTASRYHFDHPSAIAGWRGHVWVLNLHSLTRL
jgi:hypothetical protein